MINNVTQFYQEQPRLIDGIAVAKLYGEPLFSLPQDLYIPPEALEVFLESFEGPLDLLLYLIRKQNFNILDIPMLSVTEQYLAYVEQVRKRNLELAAEYLLMASMLIEIKSRMLLPVKKEAEGEEMDPRAELARRLLEYEKIKIAAIYLGQVPILDRNFFATSVSYERSGEGAPLPVVNLVDLENAWLDILHRAKLNTGHTIAHKGLSVREYMSLVLKKLQGKCFVDFESLFDIELGRPAIVVTFMALLELAKESLVELTQAEAFAPIYIRLKFN